MKQSTILGILSSVGVIGTSVLAGYGAIKAYKKHETFKETRERDPSKKEIFIFSVKDFLPAALAGTGTIICILGGTTFSKQTQASIVSAYGLVDRSCKAYRKKVAEKYGRIRILVFIIRLSGNTITYLFHMIKVLRDSYYFTTNTPTGGSEELCWKS